MSIAALGNAPKSRFAPTINEIETARIEFTRRTSLITILPLDLRIDMQGRGTQPALIAKELFEQATETVSY